MLQVFVLAIGDTQESLRFKDWPRSVALHIICIPECWDALSGDRIVLKSKVCYIQCFRKLILVLRT